MPSQMKVPRYEKERDQVKDNCANRSVFIRHLTTVSDMPSVMSGGRKFQVCTAATANARSATVDLRVDLRVAGMSAAAEEDDPRRPQYSSEVKGQTTSRRCAGADACKQRQTSVASSNEIRCGACSHAAVQFPKKGCDIVEFADAVDETSGRADDWNELA